MKTLVVYLMAGRATPELAAAAVEGGADIVELGIPFSDPLAEGPTIRLASERALARGMRTKECLECIAAVRERVDVPLVPMTYAAILEAYGYERFVEDSRAAGATSRITALPWSTTSRRTASSTVRCRSKRGSIRIRNCRASCRCGISRVHTSGAAR